MTVLVLSLFFAMAVTGALGMGPAKKMGNSPRAMQAFVREGASAAISSYREKKAAGEALEEKKAHDEAQPDEEAAVALPVPEVAADAQAGVPLAEAGQDQPSASTADNTFRADVERLERQAAAAEALGLSPDEAAVKALALAKATEAAWKKIRAEAAEGEQEIESMKEHLAATRARTLIALGDDVPHFASPGEAEAWKDMLGSLDGKLGWKLGWKAWRNAFRRALSGKKKNTKAGEVPPSTASAASVESPQDQQRKIASLRVRAKQPNDIEVGVKTAPAPDALAPAADALAPASDVPGAEPAADAPATTSDAAQECSATEQNKCKTPCAWVWSSFAVGVCKGHATADEAAVSENVQVRRERILKAKEQRKAKEAVAAARATATALPAQPAPPADAPSAEEMAFVKKQAKHRRNMDELNTLNIAMSLDRQHEQDRRDAAKAPCNDGDAEKLDKMGRCPLAPYDNPCTCAAFKEKGHCETQDDFFPKFCRKTCGTCVDESETGNHPSLQEMLEAAHKEGMLPGQEKPKSSSIRAVPLMAMLAIAAIVV